MAPGWLQCEPVFSRAFTKNELRICELVYMAVRRDNVFRPIHPSISMREGTGKTRRAWWNVPAVRSNVVAVQLEDKSSHLFACRTPKKHTDSSKKCRMPPRVQQCLRRVCKRLVASKICLRRWTGSLFFHSRNWFEKAGSCHQASRQPWTLKSRSPASALVPRPSASDSMNFTNHESLSTHRLITHSSQERDPPRSPTTLSGLPPAVVLCQRG